MSGINTACNISISRNNYNEIYVEIVDDESRARVRVKLTLEQLALALTGLSCVECIAEWNRPDKIGMRKVSESRSVVYPSPSHSSREEMTQWLLRNAEEDGWEIDPYLGSKGSIQYDGQGNTTLHYRVFRWVPIEGGATP